MACLDGYTPAITTNRTTDQFVGPTPFPGEWPEYDRTFQTFDTGQRAFAYQMPLCWHEADTSGAPTDGGFDINTWLWDFVASFTRRYAVPLESYAPTTYPSTTDGDYYGVSFTPTVTANTISGSVGHRFTTVTIDVSGFPALKYGWDATLFPTFDAADGDYGSLFHHRVQLELQPLTIQMVWKLYLGEWSFDTIHYFDYFDTVEWTLTDWTLTQTVTTDRIGGVDIDPLTAVTYLDNSCGSETDGDSGADDPTAYPFYHSVDGIPYGGWVLAQHFTDFPHLVGNQFRRRMVWDKTWRSAPYLQVAPTGACLRIDHGTATGAGDTFNFGHHGQDSHSLGWADAAISYDWTTGSHGNINTGVASGPNFAYIRIGTVNHINRVPVVVLGPAVRRISTCADPHGLLFSAVESSSGVEVARIPAAIGTREVRHTFSGAAKPKIWLSDVTNRLHLHAAGLSDITYSDDQGGSWH